MIAVYRKLLPNDRTESAEKCAMRFKAEGYGGKAGLDVNTIALPLAGVLLLNALSFCLMAYDKRCARKGKARVPERTLFLAAACFGALGGVLGMALCRHKTRHWTFRVLFPAFLIVQAALLYALYAAMLRAC